MNIKQIITIGIAGVAMGAMALDKIEVTDVKARQRYPWNGLVDIDFKLDSQPTEPYQMQVEVYDNVGKTNLPVKSVCTEGVSVESNPCMVRTNTTRIVWNAATDIMNGFKCTNVLISCQDVRSAGISNLYMIVDLGNNYKVSYTNCPPLGGWDEEYMTNKIAFRRIPASEFYMGSPLSDSSRQSNEDYHRVTISSPYYISIFKVTERQANIITGASGGEIAPAKMSWGAIRGNDCDLSSSCSIATTYSSAYYTDFVVTQNKSLSDYGWPQNKKVDNNSLIGKLRTKTSLSFDLPTEAQWECACRAGCSRVLYTGSDDVADAAGQIYGPAKSDSAGTKQINVGQYIPNANGVYDQCGNCGEWCLDRYQENLGTDYVSDPIGPNVAYETVAIANKKVMERKGAFMNYFSYCGTNYNVPGVQNGTGRVTYTGVGVRRVVRGVDARAASRSNALSVGMLDSITKDGITMDSSGGYSGSTHYTSVMKLSYDNPVYSVRLVLPAEK